MDLATKYPLFLGPLIWECPHPRVWTLHLFYIGGAFIAKVFTKFQPEKDDFNLYNGFFMEKGPEFNRFLRSKKNPNCQIIMIIPVGSQEYKRILFFYSIFISSM